MLFTASAPKADVSTNFTTRPKKPLYRLPQVVMVYPVTFVGLRPNQAKVAGEERATARPCLRTCCASPPSRIRTYDRLVKSELLYQLSYGRN